MKVRTLRPSKGVSQALTVLVLAFAVFAVSSALAPAKKSLVVFPFGLSDDVMETKGYRLQDALSKAVRAAIEKGGQFSIVGFSRNNASIKRALAEGTLKSALLLEPFTGRADGMPKAVTLGKLLRGDFALAGVAEQWDYSESAKEGKLVGTIETYDVAKMKILGSVVITATGKGDTEQAAANDAASKFAAQAVPEAIAILMAPPKKDGGG